MKRRLLTLLLVVSLLGSARASEHTYLQRKAQPVSTRQAMMYRLARDFARDFALKHQAPQQAVMVSQKQASGSTALATFVQSKSRYDGSQTLTYSPATTAGNLLVGVSSAEGSLAAATITDAANTWTSAGSQFDCPVAAGPCEIRIWYVPNATSTTNVTLNTAASDFSWAIYEFGNIVTVSPIDVQKQTLAPGTTTTPTSDAFTTTQRDLIFFAFADEGVAQGSFTQGSGYVLGENHTNHVDAQQYSLGGAGAGSQTPSITVSNTTDKWGLWIIAFKIVGG